MTFSNDSRWPEIWDVGMQMQVNVLMAINTHPEERDKSDVRACKHQANSNQNLAHVHFPVIDDIWSGASLPGNSLTGSCMS